MLINKAFVDQIIHGDCVDVLNALPEKSVDLIFADPPYNLQLQNELTRPNQTLVDGVDDEWDKFADLGQYDTFTRAWLAACRRVLKDDGTIWVIGSYHNIFRVGAIMMDLGYWILNDVVWKKCLSGDTELYALVNGRPLISSIKDLARIPLKSNRVQLPSYDEKGCLTWVDVQAWEQQPEKTRGLVIELKDGTTVDCTPQHVFPVLRTGEIEFVCAQDLQIGDILLKLGHFQLPSGIQSQLTDRAMGEFIGWYLAEGSYLANEKGIALALGRDEQSEAQKLIELIQQRLGIIGRIHLYDGRNSLHLRFNGKFMVEFIRRFVVGTSSKTKHLTREAYAFGAEFLEGILDGYLQGDGHWEAQTKRWRIGLARNQRLMTDLYVICRILGKKLSFSEGIAKYQRGQSEIFSGYIRDDVDRFLSTNIHDLGLPPRRYFSKTDSRSVAAFRENYKWTTRKNRSEPSIKAGAKFILMGDLHPIKIKDIREGTLRVHWDITVSGNHIFALASGLLTHNSNPMPNFRGTRFTNATETLIWAQKAQDQKRYTFNYHAMKQMNDEKQMPNVWEIPLCTGAERIKLDGKKAHSTQKPEALLYRVLMASSNLGDVVLDPFFGSGTTGAVAKKLKRHYIGIEREAAYVEIARARIDAVVAAPDEALQVQTGKRGLARVPFSALLDARYLQIGDCLYTPDRHHSALIRADSSLQVGAHSGSIHHVAAALLGKPAQNGWEFWHYQHDDQLLPIDRLRERFRHEYLSDNTDSLPPMANSPR